MRRRSGLTLMEVLVALTILGISAAAWVGMLGQGMHAVRGAQARDAQIRQAAEQLDRATLWTGADFAARAGRRTLNGFLWSIVEIRPSLYDVAIADTLSGSTILRTSFYVRDSSALAPR